MFDDDLKFDFLPELPKPNLDDRTFEDLVTECILRIPRYCPEWTDYNPSDPGITLVELFAWLTDQMLLRFNQVPYRHYVIFLELLGIRLRPPVAARTNLTFYITQADSYPYIIPAGTEVGTERTENSEAIIFTTEKNLTIHQPILKYFLTAQTNEPEPRVFRDRTNQWIRQNNGQEWIGEEQSLFDEQPEIGNCFYLVFDSIQSIAGNVIAITVQGIPAYTTGIDPDRPPRMWEAWDGEEWQPVLYSEGDDYTSGFSFYKFENTRIADVILHLPQSFPATNFNNYQGCWVRCVYLKQVQNQSEYARSPKITGISINSIGGTITASHSSLVRNELLGISDGLPGQTFSLQAPPILARTEEEHIIVTSPELDSQDWIEVTDFADSTPEDRHYTINSLRGIVQFGPLIQEPSHHLQTTYHRARQNPLEEIQEYSSRKVFSDAGKLESQYGSIPPKGAEIRLKSYRTGGGIQGNVEKGTLKILRSSLPYVQKVINYKTASGGTNAESLEQAIFRVPKMLRTRNRAVTKEDFETLTLAAGKGAIAQVKCLTPNNTQQAGRITVLVVPNANIQAIEMGNGLSPASFNLNSRLREEILAYLNERKLLGVEVEIREAEYVGVSVRTQIALEPGYTSSLTQEQILSKVEIALYRFLNPLTGGREQKGWEFGRPVYISDIIALLQQIPGVRFIGRVDLYEIRRSRRRQEWVVSENFVQEINPGERGLICSWRDSRLGSNHRISRLNI